MELYENFREAFVEFDDYPESRVRYFLERAVDAIPDGRFGKETDFGRFLHAAHHLTVLGSGETGSAGGGVPKNGVASKTVGSVSISYDTGSGLETDAGYWNATGYGRLFWGLLKRYRRLPIIAVGRARWP